MAGLDPGADASGHAGAVAASQWLGNGACFEQPGAAGVPASLQNHIITGPATHFDKPVQPARHARERS